MPFAAGFALAASLFLGGPSAPASPTQPTLIMPAAQTLREYVENYFADAPIMAEIAWCESRFRQYDKHGSVFRGVVNSKDVGVMQVNEHYHLDTAEKLGIDLYSIEGNLEYARYLYEKEGVQPWISSKPCWGKTAHGQLALK